MVYSTLSNQNKFEIPLLDTSFDSLLKKFKYNEVLVVFHVLILVGV